VEEAPTRSGTLKPSRDAISRLFELGDTDGDGMMTKEEFARLVGEGPRGPSQPHQRSMSPPQSSSTPTPHTHMSPPRSSTSDGITQLFNLGDTNGDGVITRAEFTNLVNRSRSVSPATVAPVPEPFQANAKTTLSQDEAAAMQHIRIAIQMGQEVVQQLMQQRMYGEVQELRDMIEMLELPLRGEGTLTQTKLESVIEEAQGLIAKLLTYGQH